MNPLKAIAAMAGFYADAPKRKVKTRQTADVKRQRVAAAEAKRERRRSKRLFDSTE